MSKTSSRQDLLDDYHPRRHCRRRRHLQHRRRRFYCRQDRRRLPELIISHTKRTEKIESVTFPCLNQTGEGSRFRFLDDDHDDDNDDDDGDHDDDDDDDQDDDGYGGRPPLKF